MEVTCRSTDLSKAVGVVEKAVATRETIPALTGIEVETTADGLRLAATDLELGIEAWFPGNVSDEGKLVLDAKLLIPISRKLPADQVTLSWDAERGVAKLASGKARFDIHSLPSEDFPEMEDVPGPAFTFQQGVVKDAVRQTLFATIQDEGRPALGGGLLELTPSEMRLVATDGNRLTYFTAPHSGDVDAEVTALVPGKTLSEVARLCEDAESSVDIRISDSRIAVEWPGVKLYSQLIQAKFPDYRLVLPEHEMANRLRIERVPFLQAVERASLISRSGIPVIVLEAEDGNLKVSAREDEVGASLEEMGVEQEGDPVRVPYRARYLTEVLKVMDDEEVVLEMDDPNKRACLRPAAGSGYRYVVMPVIMR